MNHKKIVLGLSLRQITVIGVLSSISIVLGLTGYGFIPLPIAKVTIMHIPVVIGSIIEGPIVGIFIGLIFGLFSIFQNIVTPNILSFAFINPLVSVLPRVLIGITTYYSYKIISKKSQTLGVGLGAAIGTITNTLGVLTMIYILYVNQFAQAKNINVHSAAKVIYGIALTNGIPEIIIAILISIPAISAIRKIRK